MSWRYVCNTLEFKYVCNTVEFKFHNASWKSIEFFTFWRGSIWKYNFLFTSYKDLKICLWFVSFLIVILKPHHSFFSKFIWKKTVFLSTQGKSNKLRVFEYSVLLQQLWCINLGNSFGNTWYRSNISCFVLVFKMIAILITIC